MTSAKPPVWLLDVDGVINVRAPGWAEAPHHGVVYADGHGYKMRWAPQLINEIRDVHASSLVEVRWCTTWCAWANQLERLWKLPTLQRAFTGSINGQAAQAAKLAAARQVITDKRRLIWTDDTETPVVGELYDELTAYNRALLIRPWERIGLQPLHLRMIKEFAHAGK